MSPLNRSRSLAGWVPASVVAALAVWLVGPASASAATQTITAPGETAFTVPADVTSVTIQAIGGKGGNAIGSAGNIVGIGGTARSVSATLPVTPGETLYLEVGANGSSGGFLAGGGGGGATDVRTCSVSAPTCPNGFGTLQTRLLIAGGGGGAGGSVFGGDGGDADESGANGSAGSGGASGTTTGGGAGGSNTSNPGFDGTIGDGGNGGDAGPFFGGGAGGVNGGGDGGDTTGALAGGGGAGGGYYGGGGGAGSTASASGGAGGGGGGASYVTPGATSSQLTWSSAAPSITLSYTPAAPPSPPLPPIVASVTPNSGTTNGGQTVTIFGSYYGQARQVYFGGIPAPSFQVQGFSFITAVTPAGTAGTVDVRVVGAGGISATSTNDQFTFVAPPPPPPSPSPSPPPTPTPSPPDSPEICVVPTTLNRSLASAQRLLTARHCAVGIVTEPTAKRGQQLVVVRQSIPAGTRLLPGDKVNLRLSAKRR